MSRPPATTSRAHRLRRTAGAWRLAPATSPPDLRVDADELPGEVSRRLREAVTRALDRSHAPGAQIVVRRDGAELFGACAGRIDRSEPVARVDRFVIASSTKLVVSALLGLLAERGALGLDAPVTTWLPGLPNAHQLTPRLLLAHRSGLREYARDPAIGPRLNGGEPDHTWTRAEVIEAITRLAAEREPGRRFAYRNSNYVVAAEIAERAGGRDIGALLAELVARPLGLPGFSFAASVPGAALATPHAALLGRAVDLLAVTGGRLPTDALGPTWGDGGIAASAADLARFTEALFGGALLAPTTLSAMVRCHSGSGRRAGYGLGVMLTRRDGAVVAGHDGMYWGWTASTSFDDVTGTTVSVVANIAGIPPAAVRVATAARAALAPAHGAGRRRVTDLTHRTPSRE